MISYVAFERTKGSVTIKVKLFGTPTPAQVEAAMKEAEHRAEQLS